MGTYIPAKKTKKNKRILLSLELSPKEEGHYTHINKKTLCFAHFFDEEEEEEEMA